jgi:hypothetical protein
MISLMPAFVKKLRETVVFVFGEDFVIEEEPAEVEEEPAAPSGHYQTQCRWVRTLGGGEAYGMNGNGHVATITQRESVDV